MIRIFNVLLGLLISINLSAQLNVGVTKGLINRLIPSHADQFEIAYIPKVDSLDVFEIEQVNGKLYLRGNNGVSVASALHYYLKNFCNADISWNGNQLNLPSKLPVVEEKIVKTSPHKFRYYLNYVTFNYSMVWWDWKRWEWEIDWMALNGINMPLAVGGQNSIWQRVYRDLGFSDRELEAFFSGPAYTGFHWMGLLDGYGGPLPQNWIDQQEELYKKILERQRQLGMTPVLPAFTGHVPPGFSDKFPEAKIKKVKWTVFPEADILDPDDPMFVNIGKRFINEQQKVFGTDHLYSADTFIEVMPPSNDPSYLSGMSERIYESMSAADPKAVWVMQGWMFYFKESFWQPEQIKALLNAVPNDRMLILDLWTETRPVWSRTDAYYGKPWLWCMAHNFGGTTNLFGKMPIIVNGPTNTLRNPRRGRYSGMGLTMEAIEHTPAVYQLFLDNVWRQDTIVLGEWIQDYAKRRYGRYDKNATSAWEILSATVYGYTGDINAGGSRSMANARPGFGKQGPRTNVRSFYNPEDLLPAWDKLIRASKLLKNNDGFRYDLVSVTRQVLANYTDELHNRYVLAYESGNLEEAQQYSQRFLEVLSEMDRLLASQEDFLLGNWLEDAKRWGTTQPERDLYEWNARNLITLWHGKMGKTLHDYASKQWSGLMENFYKKRWAMFFDYVNKSMASGTAVDMEQINEQIREWEWSWVQGKEVYPTTTKGDAIAIVKQLHKKYAKQIRNSYKNVRDPLTGETVPAPLF
ncbi:alpha-N-acetylglucosaminidase [Sphingobacterium spiritivorum]|uniref:alpha-N-acetylglucosaminidase n=1 Tax=Sphingobacterium spiritivorum TaxID=258 RepID=UPI003DA4D67F